MKSSSMDDCGGFTSEEISVERRVDLDTTVAVMALTAKEMNSSTKRLRRRLAASLVLC